MGGGHARRPRAWLGIWGEVGDLRSEEGRVARRAEPPADRDAAGHHDLPEPAFRVHLAPARDVPELLLPGVAPAVRDGAPDRPLAVDMKADFRTFRGHGPGCDDELVALGPPLDLRV